MTIETQLVDAVIIFMIGMLTVSVILGLLVYCMQTVRKLSCRLEQESLRLHVN